MKSEKKWVIRSHRALETKARTLAPALSTICWLTEHYKKENKNKKRKDHTLGAGKGQRQGEEFGGYCSNEGERG